MLLLMMVAVFCILVRPIISAGNPAEGYASALLGWWCPRQNSAGSKV
jgi:hypothetical protein